MTYSHAIAYQNAFEIWQSTNWLNSEKTIRVVVCGKRRFRCDTKEQVSAQVLKRLGYKMVNRAEIS